VSLEARDMPLYHVLEQIAGQLGLIVARAGNRLTFKSAPTLTVNGVREAAASYDPWDEELRPLVDAIRSGQIRPGGAGAPRIPGQGGFMEDGGMDGLQMFGPEGFGPTPGAITLAGLGANMIAVAEPGSDPNGARGYWLTVYKLSGDSMTRVAVKFHAAHTAARAR
jgi:hypothetical protein